MTGKFYSRLELFLPIPDFLKIIAQHFLDSTLLIIKINFSKGGKLVQRMGLEMILQTD
jgi:hypothetical protein